MSSRRIFPLSLCVFLSVAVLAAVSVLVVPASGQSEAGWVQEAKLMAGDGGTDVLFGRSVSIDGDSALVGADRDDVFGDRSGSAYVFLRNGGEWAQQAKILPGDGAAQDYFGFSVAIDGDTAVMGAYGDDDNGSGSGSAYVFLRSGGVWTQQAKLLPGDGAASDWFGWSVAISGDTIAVGAYLDDEVGADSGSAYVFVRNAGVWTQQAEILPADGAEQDYFGYSVSLDADTLVVGAARDDDAGADSGSAYVFVRSGSTWTQQDKLVGVDGAAGDQFGYSTSIDGDSVAVGAMYDDDGGSASGSAYVFVRTGSAWSQEAKLVAADAGPAHWFGSSASIDQNTLVIGSHGDDQHGVRSGSAYVFLRSEGEWTEAAKLDDVDGYDYDQFGNSVGIAGDTALIGVYGDDDNGYNAGAAYVYRWSANEPPNAADDYAATLVDEPVLVNVAANDTDPNGNLDPSTAIVISGPAHGSVENQGDGTITYTPDPGWSGADSFDYEIFDTEGLSDTATVYLVAEAEGVTRYVAPTGGDSGFCTDPENPCLTVQYALDTGHDGDAVKVAEGTYSDLHVRPRADITSTGVVTQVVYVETSVTVEGGYTTSNWVDPDPEAHPTIIDPGGGGRGVYVTGDIQPTLAGLRIQYGDATGMGGWPNPWIGGEEDAGGGMYVISATATIRDNQILTNTAQQEGLFLIYSDATVEGNLVSGNNWGGAQLYWCGATVIHNTISDNYGTGLLLLFNNCPQDGDCHSSMISHNTLQANTEGGLYMFINSATIDGNYIAHNSNHEGAGLYMNLVWAQVSNNVFTGNHADVSGGGVYMIGDGDQVPKLMNNTFTDNTAGDGSGIYISSWGPEPGTFDLSNSIVASHTLGIYADAGTNVILDGVLWYNTPVTVAHSLTSTVIVEHQLTGDPEFVWPAGGDYHISPTSAARDTGAWAFWHPEVDIDGQPRRMGWAPDLGADEYADARLYAIKEPSTPVVGPGDPLAYTIVITSDGVFNATAVEVVDSMDGWQRATDAWSTQGPCTITDPGWGGEVVCTPGTMVTGTEVVVTLLAEVSPEVPGLQQMVNVAAISANETGWSAEATTLAQDCHARINDDPTEYTSIQAAVDAAGTGDLVKVAGTCLGVGERAGKLQQVYLDKSLTIQGGYTTTNWITPDPEANPTTLDALGQGRVLYVTEPAPGAGVNATVAGLGMTGGDTSWMEGDPWELGGGGLHVVSATITLEDNRIFGNTAFLVGGLYVEGSAVTLRDNRIFDNTADFCGGLFLASCHGSLTGDVITGNSTTEWSGGGADIQDSQFTLDGIVVSGNSSARSGGGLSIRWSDVTVLNSVVADNVTALEGSGLIVGAASVRLVHTTVARNSGGDGSGIHVTSADFEPWVSSVALTNTVLVDHSVGIRVTGGNTVTVDSILWYHTPITVSQSPTASVTVENEYWGDPAFDADGYHLTGGSAALDLGVDAGVGEDIDGEPRPLGAGYDLGADELDTAPGPVILSVEPPETTTYVGQQFEVSVLVQAGEQEVDGAAAYLDFDPDVLQVVSIQEGDTLPIVLVNDFDNEAGTIDYAAGTLGPGFPNGGFDLVTVTFEAVAASDGTTLAFHHLLPRRSNATFGGESVLHHTEDGTVVVSDKAALVGSVTLQGRPEPPDPRWSVPLTVRLYPPGGGDPAYEFTPTTDESGVFTVTGILPDSYAVLVKHSHALQNREDVALVLGPNEVALGELREGDANDDNCVTLVDFSILATTYALGQGDPGYDPRADFNGDGWVTLLDFSLLVTNFGACGEEPPGGAAGPPVAPRPEGVEDDVFIVVQPPLSMVEPGETFTVTAEVQAGSQLVDAAQASIDFDSALLQVREMTGNTAVLPIPLWSTFDNELGTLDYAAGTFSDFPSGTFTLVEIVFEAMGETPGTALAFHFAQPRMTDVTHGGYSVLTGHTDGLVRIYVERRLHLPLVFKDF